MEKDKEIEIEVPVVDEDLEASIDNDSIQQENSLLMNWEKGLVGWDSPSDQENPLY